MQIVPSNINIEHNSIEILFNYHKYMKTPDKNLNNLRLDENKAINHPKNRILINAMIVINNLIHPLYIITILGLLIYRSFITY